MATASSKNSIQKVEGLIYRVYFEDLYKPLAEQSDDLGVCIAIADNIEAAIQKVHEAFPGKAINSIYAERPNFGEPPTRPTGQMIVL